MNGINKKVTAGAVALGVALGSYGIASAASGSTTTTPTPATPSTSLTAPAAPPGWGAQRSDETSHRRHGRQGQGDRPGQVQGPPSFASRPTPTGTPRTRRI